MITKSYLNSKTCLVYDFGLCVEIALKLAEKFEKVFYYSPWADGFPSSDKAMIGDGFQNGGLYKVKEEIENGERNYNLKF